MLAESEFVYGMESIKVDTKMDRFEGNEWQNERFLEKYLPPRSASFGNNR